MHHIAGDLNSPQNLYLPSILKSFSKIWEQVVITIVILILILITIITILQDLGRGDARCQNPF